MKIFVSVKTNAKEDAVQSVNGSHYSVRIKASPVQGKANEALLRLMADFLDIPVSRLRIVSGFSSKQKILEVQ